MCERPDGSRYALHWYFQRHGIGDWSRIEMQGGVEHPDGRREPFVALVPDLAFRDDNRRFEGGTLTMTMADGSTRPLTLTAVSDTGFHLGTGLYHGFDGMSHGQWRGRAPRRRRALRRLLRPRDARAACTSTATA